MSSSRLLDLLFPPRCAGCGRPGETFCTACVASLSAPLRLNIGTLPCIAVGTYESALRAAVLRMKNGRRDVGERLGLLLAQRADALMDAEVCLVPVPTAAKRRRERGFDQASLLAYVVGRERRAPVFEALRRSVGDAQRGRSRNERLAAVGRFTPRVALARTFLREAEVALVDDVATTGATLRDAAMTLRRIGVSVRGALVVAYAPRLR